jgi:hypothetical protein
LARKEASDIICPFCSAPYKKLVPSDALELKCDNCGATFDVSPKIARAEEPEGEADNVEKQTASVVSGDVDAEEAEQIYDQLFAEYVAHWGLQTGTQLLDNEIKAYTWQGDSFAEAVRKIAQREKRKTSR